MKHLFQAFLQTTVLPHQLPYRVNACMDSMTSHSNCQWLRSLIIGDEKWVLYIKYTHRRQWPSPGQTGVATPKADLHSKKVMLSVWWGVSGIIHWETLPNGCTITADLYCQHNWPGLPKNSKESRIEFTVCMITQDPMLQSWPAKNDWSSNGFPLFIHLILPTWLQRTTICFVLFLIICVRKSSTT